MTTFIFRYIILAVIYWIVEHARKVDIMTDISHLVTLASIYVYKLSNYLFDYFIKKLNNSNDNNITSTNDESSAKTS
ncbi:putative ORFan [Tupanvirus deep ocean]|uniref:ORFan n=2 Tax=Tupanvirus TaxID=2094720 RepID=A0AC62A7C1_9VIRU|nr:putative ORFan [Tupanvirus deep ocean]QKU33685.1 putative ORFan [Tupanvirus deep ocean]